jgi:hypothetical protein
MSGDLEMQKAGSLMANTLPLCNREVLGVERQGCFPCAVISMEDISGE